METGRAARTVPLRGRLQFRAAMAEHMTLDPLEPEWTAALAVRLINLKSHVLVRGSRVTFRFHGKHRALVRTALVDSELAEAMRELLAAKGGRARFRYRNGDGSATSPGDA